MKILARFPVTAPVPGRYHAFPTLVRQGPEVWLGFRDGVAGNFHGTQGCLRLFAARTERPESWRELPLLFCEALPNELDAIVSGPFERRLLLSTRNYLDGVSTPYLSVTDGSVLGAGVPLVRRPLAACLDCGGQPLTPLAGFGHVRGDRAGRLFMPLYGHLAGERWASPWVLRSADLGATWRIAGRPAVSDQVGEYLNETSLCAEAGGFVAVMRSDHAPYRLRWSRGDADAERWEAPRDTGLVGHAPMLERLADGRLVLLYRDLSHSPPGVALALLEGERWVELGRVMEYTGPLYDGGYGDLLELSEGRLLVTAYLSDERANPWIEGAVVAL